MSDVCLAATWVDVDQDGDLDLVLARYAASPRAALAQLTGEAAGAGGVAVFLNTGVAPPTPKGQPLAGLTTAFRRADGPPALLPAGAVVQIAAADLDGDHDVDLLALVDAAAPALSLNDRLLRFTLAPPPTETVSRWNGALALDMRNRGRSDLLLLRVGQSPLLLHPPAGDAKRWEPGATNAPPLRQAHAVDIDLDGWTDVVGLSNDGRPVLLHNDGAGRLVARPDAFGPATDLPADALAALAADLDGACRNGRRGPSPLARRGAAGGARRARLSGHGDQRDQPQGHVLPGALRLGRADVCVRDRLPRCRGARRARAGRPHPPAAA